MVLSKGVLQLASPVLFCLCIDNLLAKLSNCGAGCYIGSVFVGAIAYTDDIVLLAPTLSALHKMLQCVNCMQVPIILNSMSTNLNACMIVPPRDRRSFLTYNLHECVFILMDSVWKMSVSIRILVT